MEKEIKELIKKELEKANLKFPKFASAHEGFAVILEERDELIENLKIFEEQLNSLWVLIKKNQNEMQDNQIKKMSVIFIGLIKEAVQVAAMIEKYKCLFNIKEK